MADAGEQLDRDRGDPGAREDGVDAAVVLAVEEEGRGLEALASGAAEQHAWELACDPFAVDEDGGSGPGGLLELVRQGAKVLVGPGAHVCRPDAVEEADEAGALDDPL